MAANGLKIVFGGAGFLTGTVESVKPWLETIAQVGIKTIDTARLYGASEELLGKVGAPARFTIDTKHPGGFSANPSSKDVVVATFRESLKLLQTDSVDVYYMHAPDKRIPIKETLSGLDQLHKEGAFKRLGLSNYSGADVEEVVRVAKENGFVLPTVYQGNYSAVARRTELEIFPVLRKHNIAFYAYSPIAGGFLAKSKATLTSEGRFTGTDQIAQIYNGMYNRPALFEALDDWERIAAAEGISRAELAYRWVTWHGLMKEEYGDAVIVGARKEEQLLDTVRAMNAGPLSEASVKKIDEMWEKVKDETSLDNYEMISAK